MSGPTGEDVLRLCESQLGRPYQHVNVPKGDRLYRGPFDCAELASWAVGVLIGKPPGMGRYFGCSREDADAFSGFWLDDTKRYGTPITPEEAFGIPGAVLLRRARLGKMGHVAVSDGLGMTVEAHSKMLGVCRRTVQGRVWDLACLVPGITYSETKEG